MQNLIGWNGYWPKETRDKVGLFTVLVGTPMAVLFEAIFIVPNFFTFGSTDWLMHAAIAIFLLVNFVGNLYKILAVDPSGRSRDLPSVLRPGWRYCFRCQLNAPPRSYHCPMCEACILKRDHHCSFAGTCIGYHNHRYYLMSVVYAHVSCMYAIWWHWSYIWEFLGGFKWTTLWHVVTPHLAFIAFQISFKQFFLAGVQMTAMVCILLTTYLFLVQAICIIRGHTQVEFRDGIRAYDLGPLMNLKDVLGKKWFLACTCPFLGSPLLGDGLKFQRKVDIESVKDM